MSKYMNLAVFIDGTGNNDFKKPIEKQTNVARLWHACEQMSLDAVQQRVCYKPGVGTRRWESLRGGVRGAYLMDRVDESLTWLLQEIRIAREDGVVPRVYLFGFSRGAYAVRCLAQKLDHEIEVLGVWDTVKATIQGMNVDVAPKTVRHAFHAMAIDEHRGIFDVTRFKDSPQAVEVWFPGCHSDVGGGYKEAALSYAPLNWMVRMATQFGLLVDNTKIPKEPFFADSMPVVHDETSGFGWKLANVLTGDWFFNRAVAATDVVYPTVTQLNGLGYSPDYLPQTCVVWKEKEAMRNLA